MIDIREERLPVSFFEKNRGKLASALPDRAMAVIFSGKAPVMSEDIDYPFFANRNFYYLTGIEQEESIFVFQKEGEVWREVLFLLPSDPEKEKWTGKRLTKDDAFERSGILDIRSLEESKVFLEKLLQEDISDISLEVDVPFGPSKDFERMVLSHRVKKNILSLAPILTRFRMKKEPCEIEMIRKAISLTEEAMREMARDIALGVSELELLATFEYALKKRGCFFEAFPSIVGAGEHTLCLHHSTPSGVLKEGDILQLDVGGRVSGVCADISRVFPVSGVFSEKQECLYEIVRTCQEEAILAVQPGITIRELNEITKKAAERELLKAGILSSGEDISKYYWHNVSHHLGHDVHDVCVREMPLEKDMVITVEPGIYVPQWGFGMRLEEDILVSENGCENLSFFFPREKEEIRKWVKEG